jgi:hypothetical protein
LRAVRLAVLALLLATGACRPEPPASAVVELGVHRAEFRVPSGWLHANHGHEQRFERQLAHISLADLGPASSKGLRRVVHEARQLFRAGQWEDARTLLVAVEPRDFFSSKESWDGVARAWKSVNHIRRQPGSDPPGEIREDVVWEVENAYHQLLVQASALPPPSLESLAMSQLRELRHDRLRDIASQQAMAVSGRPALRIDTWDRLSHDHRRSHVFVLSEGRLLCLRMETGRYEVLQPGFAALLDTLTIQPLQGAGDV